jgi:hypothetical protein
VISYSPATPRKCGVACSGKPRAQRCFKISRRSGEVILRKSYIDWNQGRTSVRHYELFVVPHESAVRSMHPFQDSVCHTLRTFKGKLRIQRQTQYLSRSSFGVR